MAETIKLEVTRYAPERHQAPTSQSFEVPYRKDWVVLDALNYIKDNLDGSLSYRWSCRMGILSQHAGIWGCTFVGECTRVCPKHVDPAGAIQQYKLTAAKEWFKSLLMPWGAK